MNIENRLAEIQSLVDSGLNNETTHKILELLNAADLFPKDFYNEFKLYNEFLPKNDETPYTEEVRLANFLWLAFDKLPISIAENFAIPFRRILAPKMFKKVGKNFIALWGCYFAYPQNIEIGDYVFFNSDVFLDGKAGITIGNYVALTEKVEIYTHGHGEHNHEERSYGPVVLKDFVKCFTHSTILPGVTVGEQAILAGCAVVNKDVEPNALVAGIPAKPIRDRKNLGNKREELNHIWLNNGSYETVAGDPKPRITAIGAEAIKEAAKQVAVAK